MRPDPSNRADVSKLASPSLARRSFSNVRHRMKAVCLALLLVLFKPAFADPPAQLRNVVEFSYGTSYGECMGYCRQEFRVSGSAVAFVAQGSYPQKPDPVNGSIRMQKLRDFHSLLTLNGRETEELWRLVRSVKYADLSERIGCPDCRDGGAEWLEFTTADHKVKRIVFEKDHAPVELKELSAWCDKLQRRFKTPDDWRQNLPPPAPSYRSGPTRPSR